MKFFWFFLGRLKIISMKICILPFSPVTFSLKIWNFTVSWKSICLHFDENLKSMIRGSSIWKRVAGVLLVFCDYKSNEPKKFSKDMKMVLKSSCSFIVQMFLFLCVYFHRFVVISIPRTTWRHWVTLDILQKRQWRAQFLRNLPLRLLPTGRKLFLKLHNKE